MELLILSGSHHAQRRRSALILPDRRVRHRQSVQGLTSHSYDTPLAALHRTVRVQATPGAGVKRQRECGYLTCMPCLRDVVDDSSPPEYECEVPKLSLGKALSQGSCTRHDEFCSRTGKRRCSCSNGPAVHAATYIDASQERYIGSPMGVACPAGPRIRIEDGARGSVTREGSAECTKAHKGSQGEGSRHKHLSNNK